jgi:hypothetical protein
MTSDTCHTHCLIKKPKYRSGMLPYDTVTPTTVDLQLTAEGTVRAPTCFFYTMWMLEF